MFHKILLLDTARKYFAPEQIKEYVDVMSVSGMNQLQLYFSDNQGFRLALNDMMITTSIGNTYDLSKCLGKGYAQPDKNMYPHDTNAFLTQTEMDDLIDYAHEKGIEIIPCLNSPGHMGAILEHFPEFRYTNETGTSKSSIELKNPEASAFALAYVEKYVKYFQEKGCRYFNLGADEYANDVEGMGFEGLMNEGLYEAFVIYLNQAAQIVLDAGMIPRMFNDGAYYAGERRYQLNPKIQVYYWDCYDRATSVSTIVEMGHEVMNTSKHLYYVVAENPWVCVTEETVETFDKVFFADQTVVENPSGIMMCIWCDDARDETRTTKEIMDDTLKLVHAFAKNVHIR